MRDLVPGYSESWLAMHSTRARVAIYKGARQIQGMMYRDRPPVNSYRRHSYRAVQVDASVHICAGGI